MHPSSRHPPRLSSSLVDALARTQILDCNGRITHTLTLLPDGTVEVVTGPVRAVVDPARKVALRPRGVVLGDQILGYAATLAHDGVA